MAVLCARADDSAINVLCYHRFQENAGKGNDSYWIKPERFEQHLKFLKDEGYNVVSMKKYLDYIEGKDKLPEKSVIITIDDGYRNVYENGYPVLKKYGYPATVYLYSVFYPGGRSALTAEQVAEMSENGIEFGCHSHTHPYLTRRKPDTTDREYLKWLRSEIITPKKYLEKKLGMPVESFAYPYGLYSDAVVQVVREAGYRAAFSVVPSFNTAETHKYKLKRTMIYSSTTTEKLREILERRPMRLSLRYPEDGEITEKAPVTIKAVLAEDSLLNTATIKFKMGNVTLYDSKYDPATRTLTYRYERLLGKGVHVAGVTASGHDGAEYEYRWMFVIGRPVDFNEAGIKTQ